MRVFRRPQQIHRQPEHTLVVRTHELFEGAMITRLCSPYERRLLQLQARFEGHCGGSRLPVQVFRTEVVLKCNEARGPYSTSNARSNQRERPDHSFVWATLQHLEFDF